MSILLDCEIPSKNIKDEVRDEFKKLNLNNKPKLAIIMVGFDDSAMSYIKGKKNDCIYCGIEPLEYILDKKTTTKELESLIINLNNDDDITGIIVEMPLPKHIDSFKIASLINIIKDVDGINPINIGNLVMGNDCFSPCTPTGISNLLDYHNIDVSGKLCVILGRSITVGKPMSIIILNKNGTPIVCHSKTKNIHSVIKQADILISSVGIPSFITGEMIKNGCILIDVGINYKDNKLVGDVDFESCKGVASKITKVPKGVGLMTRAALMKNILKSYIKITKNVDK